MRFTFTGDRDTSVTWVKEKDERQGLDKVNWNVRLFISLSIANTHLQCSQTQTAFGIVTPEGGLKQFFFYLRWLGCITYNLMYSF